MRYGDEDAQDKPAPEPHDGSSPGRPSNAALEAHALAARVMSIPRAERSIYVARDQDLQTPEFCELMIGLARERRGRSPKASLHLATLAATAAKAAWAGGSAGIADASVLALAEVGNAYRILGDFRRSGFAFGLAREQLASAGNPRTEAELYSLFASHLDRTGDDEGARRACLRAEEVYRQCGHLEEVARVRLIRGVLAQQTGHLEESFRLHASALGLLDSSSAPRLVLVAAHNYANTLVIAGQLESALEAIRANQFLYRLTPSRSDLPRSWWVEAQAQTDLGLWSEAEKNLQAALNRFEALDCPYETCLVKLDMAHLLAERSRNNEAIQHARGALRLSHRCGGLQEVVRAHRILATTTPTTRLFL